MRCGRAQRHLITATERLRARTRAAAERHAARCAACREELRLTRALFAALDEGGRETAVPPRLEQATLRAVRSAAAEEAERAPRRWTYWLPLPALAVAALAALAIVPALERAGESPSIPGDAPAPVARRPAPPPVPVAVAAKPRAPEPPPEVAEQRTPEPPAELAERPDLFIDLPILRHMEKLEHYEQIQTTGASDAPVHPADGEGQTNG